MKLLIVLMTTCLLQVSAAGFAQKVTYAKKGATLEQIFGEIRKQTGYFVVYAEGKVNKQAKLDVNFRNTDLTDVLDVISKSQDLSYSINEKNIGLKPKESSFFADVIARFQAIDVRGKVVDSLGNGLAGASVGVKGTRISTSTSANGDFYLKNVDQAAILVVSYLGYVTKEILVDNKFNHIQLQISFSKLDEVKIIAYGITNKRLTTGNSHGITARDIERSPINNPLLALAGRTPGIFIGQESGLAGSALKINIQGTNSLTKGNDPFYIVDGVPYTSQILPTQSNVLGGPGFNGSEDIGNGNPFSYLNPADIESIEILKDADATAIYGSRAANGAVLITTKKGTSGVTRVNINMQQGAGQVVRRYHTLSAKQYLEMRREAYKNDGLELPGPSDINFTNYDLTVYDQNRDTDWQKEFLGGTALYSDVQASVSGGSNQTTFRLNGGYHREITVFPGDFRNIKKSVGLNLNHTSPNKRFRLQLSANYMNDDNLLPPTDLTNLAIQTSPNAPALRKADGSLNWERIETNPGTRDSISTFNNPIRSFENTYSIKVNNLIANTNLSYSLMKGLDVKTNLGYTDLTTNELTMAPLTGVEPERVADSQRGASYGNGRITSWIIEPQLNYRFVIGPGTSEFLFGGTLQESNKRLQNVHGSGYSSDEAMKDYSSANRLTSSPSLRTLYRYAAIFARFNYNWMDRYIVNLSARRDGSSRFGAANKFHNFGAVGFAWLFSNEPLLKEKTGFLSFGKLRGSYGSTGNDQIGDYSYLSRYGIIPDWAAPNPYQGITGLQPNLLANPYLEWELTKKLQFGLDLGFIEDRILLGVNYYRNRSSNQLVEYALANQSGYGSIVKNFPATLQNSGWELTLSTINLKKNKFYWNTNINFTANRNELIAFPDLATSSYSKALIVGEPFNVYRAFDYAGVNTETGLFQFRALDGSLTSTPNGVTDRTVLIRPSPKFYGGIQNTMSYKGFELDFLFQFVKQIGINYPLGTGFNVGISFNKPENVLDRWQKPGDVAQMQKFSNNLIAFDALGSTLVYRDASYMRLKNASLSYELPSDWISKIRVQHWRIFIQAQNLLTISDYIGPDPENLTLNQVPPLRVITGGIQLTF